MSEGTPHPREVFDWQGDDKHEQDFLDALGRGRLHHAWLVTGPPGIGKATFAYRAARRLLGARPESALGPLGAAPDDPTSRQIIGRAHPDLLALQRDPEDGKTRRGIPVEEARALPEFFAKSPAVAPYRVAIIDTADDLGPSAANAVLKTLEEPPTRGILFLLTDAPGALLATLRSRCRRLRVIPPEAAAAASWVADRAGLSVGDARRLLEMAQGAPGGAWRLAGEGALETDRLAGQLLDSLPNPDEGLAQSLADSFRGAAGAARFSLFFNRLAARVHAMAVRQAKEDAGVNGSLDRWAELWNDLNDMPRQAEAVNLDRADVLHTLLSRLRAMA